MTKDGLHTHTSRNLCPTCRLDPVALQGLRTADQNGPALGEEVLASRVSAFWKVSPEQALATARELLPFVAPLLAQARVEERKRITEAIEAEADGTFNELRARHFRTAARIARGKS